MVDLQISLGAPDFREKVLEFFWLNYQENLANVKPEEESKKSDKGVELSISVDDYPEEDITQEGIRALLRLFHETRTAYARPLEKVETREESMLVLMDRYILRLAKSYLLRTVWFLLGDEKYHSNARFQIDATRLLDFEAGETMSLWSDLPKLMFVVNWLNPPFKPLGEQCSLLEHSIQLFFDVFQSVFPLKEVGRCREAYNRLFAVLGEPEAINGYVDNIRRRHKTMYRAIVEFRRRGGIAAGDAAAERIKDLEAQVASMRDTLEKVDRRQRDFLSAFKKKIGGFVELFRPKANEPVPAREEVARALLPEEAKDRYDCLKSISEPHRSQIKAVIDYTLTHPIVFEGKSKDDFTLSDAAEEVFRANEEKWDKIPGSFPTWQHLKSACYNLRKKDSDPFNYET